MPAKGMLMGCFSFQIVYDIVYPILLNLFKGNNLFWHTGDDRRNFI